MTILIAASLALVGVPTSAAVSCDLKSFEAEQTARRQVLIKDAQNLIDEVKELGRQRSAVAAQRTKLAKMNPVSRGLKSTIDATYDRKALADLDRSLANQMSVAAQRGTLIKLEGDMLQLERQTFVSRCVSE